MEGSNVASTILGQTDATRGPAVPDILQPKVLWCRGASGRQKVGDCSLGAIRNSMGPEDWPCNPHFLSGHSKWVKGVAVTSEGRRVISVSDDGTMKIWDLENGREIKTLQSMLIASRRWQ